MPERLDGLTREEIGELFRIYGRTNNPAELCDLPRRDERFRRPIFHAMLRQEHIGPQSHTDWDEKVRESQLAKFHLFFTALHYDAYDARLAEAATDEESDGAPDPRFTQPRSIAELALVLSVLAEPGDKPLIPDWDEPSATVARLVGDRAQGRELGTADLPAHRPSLAACLLFHCRRCETQFADLHRYYLDLSDRAAFAETLSDEIPDHVCPNCGSRRLRVLTVLANEADLDLDPLLAQCRLVVPNEHTRLFLPPQLTVRDGRLDRILEVRLMKLETACEKVFPHAREKRMTSYGVVYSLAEFEEALPDAVSFSEDGDDARARQFGVRLVDEVVRKVQSGLLPLDMAMEHVRRIAQSGVPLHPPITLYSDLGVPPEIYLTKILVTAAIYYELETPAEVKALLAVLTSDAYRRVGAHGLSRTEMARARGFRAEAAEGRIAGLVDRMILESEVERAERECRFADAVDGLERLVELWRSSHADPPRTPADRESFHNQLAAENRLGCAYENAGREFAAAQRYRAVEARAAALLEMVDEEQPAATRYLLSGVIANQGNLCRRLRDGLSPAAAEPAIAALSPEQLLAVCRRSDKRSLLGEAVEAARTLLADEPPTVGAMMPALADRAVKRCRQALKLSEAVDGHYFAAIQADVLARLAADTGLPDQDQETYLRTAIRHARAGSALQVLTSATADLSELRERAGAPAEAAELGEEVLRLLLRRRVAGGPEAPDHLGDMMLDVAARVAELRDRLGEPARVLAAIETAKCGLLSLELERSPLRLAEVPADEAAVAELHELESRRERVWAGALADGDRLVRGLPTEADTSVDEMDAAEVRITELKRDLRSRHPRFDAMCRWSTVEPFELDDLRRFMRRRPGPVRVVGFFVRGERLWWYQASGSDLVTGKIPLGAGGSQQLSARIVRLRGQLLRGESGPEEEIGALLAPAFEALPHEPGTPTLICPHESLLWLAWALLPVGGRPLVEHGPISTVPGLSMLPGLPDSVPVGDRPEVLVVADPQRGGDGALPGATAEAEALQAFFGEQCHVLAGAAATPEAVLAAAPGRQIVHFACHGDFGGRLALAGGALTSEAIAERLNLRRVALVNLAACDSGLVRPEAGTEIDGITRACLSAGATAVLGSVWPLDDDAARMFSSAFYEHLAARGEPGVALQETQLDCRRGRYGAILGEPRHWAGYVLVGTR